MKNNFDAIVLGVGSMGSATCYQLASRGYRVLGLEQFEIPHELGSHAGQSRIIRKAYFEHPDYVPLLERAYENWKQLEAGTGSQVYFKTWGVNMYATLITAINAAVPCGRVVTNRVSSICQRRAVAQRLFRAT